MSYSRLALGVNGVANVGTGLQYYGLAKLKEAHFKEIYNKYYMKRPRSSSGGSQTSARSSRSSGGALGSGEVSKYHEEHVVYRHRGGKKHVSKEKRLLSRIEKAIAFEQPIQTLCRQSASTFSGSAGDLVTGLYQIPLLSWNSSTYDQGHAFNVLNDMFNLQTSATAGATIALADYKIELLGASMEITFKNTGSYGAIMDLYWCECRKDYPINTIASALNTNIQAYDTAQGKITAGTLGTTPFECREFVEHFLIKSKERVYFDNGNQQIKTYKIPHKRHIDGDLVNAAAGTSAKAGYTCALVVGLRGFINTNSSGVAQMEAYSVEVAAEYKFKVKPGVSNQPAYLAQL
nr:MAG: capsid protein [Cressdnaviricota sp.]